jgi:hypothetical protein
MAKRRKFSATRDVPPRPREFDAILTDIWRACARLEPPTTEPLPAIPPPPVATEVPHRSWWRRPIA